jgi:hypothetical protein
MEIGRARRTGTTTCGRCGGSGQFGVGSSQDSAGNMTPGVCYRCGGSGQQPAGFEGQTVVANVYRSSERRDGTGARRGTIDVLVKVTTYSTPRVKRGHGCIAVAEIPVAERVVGRMVDGRTFDLTIRAASMKGADLLAFEQKSVELHRKVNAGLGPAYRDMISPEDEAAVLREFGIIA